MFVLKNVRISLSKVMIIILIIVIVIVILLVVVPYIPPPSICLESFMPYGKFHVFHVNLQQQAAVNTCA